MLLIQTLLICLITGNFSQTFWFSYVLFLIFLGGILVLFMYVTSLASNEIFSFSIKILTLSRILLVSILLLTVVVDNNFFINYLFNNEINSIRNINSYINENSITLNKLYNFPINIITILLINYLFLTLIAVVKITNIFEGPLRPKI